MAENELSIEMLKVYLIDQYNIGILQDMISPIVLNAVDGKKLAIISSMSRIPAKQISETDNEYAWRVAEFINLLHPNARYFAFHQYIPSYDNGRSTHPLLRYGIVE